MGKTKIEWATDTWNPVTGCSKVSPGCTSCYAETMSHRLSNNPKYALATKADGTWSGVVSCHPEALDQPVQWKKPRRIFVCSMSDLFHSQVPWDFIVEVFNTMAATYWHTYQVLTKRPGRMAHFAEHIWPKQANQAHRTTRPLAWGGTWEATWPSNVWAVTAVESQKYAPRLDCLLRVPAKVRFISAEPLLGPLDLRRWLNCRFDHCNEEIYDCTGCDGLGPRPHGECGAVVTPPVLSWVIVGGESGHGARPMDLAWARGLVGQCQAAGVACFVKQLGSEPMSGLGDQDLYEELIELAQTPGGVRLSDQHGSTFRRDTDGRRLGHYLKFHDPKGGNPSEWPNKLRVREMPQAAGGS